MLQKAAPGHLKVAVGSGFLVQSVEVCELSRSSPSSIVNFARPPYRKSLLNGLILCIGKG
jgi:hypothetical protein